MAGPSPPPTAAAGARPRHLGVALLVALSASSARAAPQALIVPLGTDRTWTSTLAALPGIRVLEAPPADAAGPPTRAIKAALARARRALAGFDLESARAAVADATAALAPHTRTTAVLELEREALTLEVTLAHAGRDAPRLEAALRAYSARFPGALPPPRSGWPPALAERLASQAPPRTSVLTVDTTPPGAELWIDGESVGTAPRTVTQLVAGPHVVEATLSGYVSVLERVELTPAAATTRTLTLPLDLPHALAAGARTPALEAELTRLAAGAAVVWAERVARGIRFTTGRAQATSAGLSASALSEAIRLAQGLPPSPPPAELASEGAAPWWPWVALGAGLTTAGAGVGVRVSAVGLQDQLDRRAGALTQVEAYAIQADAEGRATAGTVLIAAGVAVAVGVGTWLWLDGGAP